MRKRIKNDIHLKYRELRADSRVDDMDKYIQHGTCTTLRHSLGVAYVSLYIHDAFRFKFDRDALTKAAIIHDYYLYDWHDKDKTHSLHGFKHPKTALKNAKEDFNLKECEKDAIINHMFPLIPNFPKYKEGRLLCLADKICAIYEMFKRNPYKDLYKTIEEEIHQ
jgi:uncharacterized protein